MDGTVMWTDSLPDEVIELLVEQIHGYYFEYSTHDNDQVKNNLQMNYTEYTAHDTVWTWDEVGEEE
jgi:predicted transcriptional regulator